MTVRAQAPRAASTSNSSWIGRTCSRADSSTARSASRPATTSDPRRAGDPGRHGALAPRRHDDRRERQHPDRRRRPARRTCRRSRSRSWVRRTFAPGETRDVPFQVPVPGLGPPTFEATELGRRWEVRVNLDVSGFDPDPRSCRSGSTSRRRSSAPGVVRVAEFAPLPRGGRLGRRVRRLVWLDPSPLCVGAPFTGRLTLEAAPARTVQEVRIELRVQRRVHGGWRAQRDDHAVDRPRRRTRRVRRCPDDRVRRRRCPTRWLPTIATEHGRSSAQVHVIVATAWARDPHLVRDVDGLHHDRALGLAALGGCGPPAYSRGRGACGRP